MSRKFNKIVTMFLFIVFAICVVGFYKTTSVSSAQNLQMSQNTYLPQTSLENTALISASAVYRDENLTAIIEDAYKFTLYFEDKSVVVSQDKNNLKDILDVKLFNDSTLFFSANARLYAYDIESGAYEKVKLNGSIEEPVSYFDFNDNYLVTTYQDSCKIFSIENNSLDDDTFKSNGSEIEILNGSTISINDDNTLFIVGKSGVYKTLASQPAIQTNDNTLTSTTPSQIISNDEFIYYVISDKVYSLSTNGGVANEFTTLESDKAYDLGNISSAIKNISFCDDKLLIVQSDNIQEFKIKGNELIFTGFAIAKNKTAYNRVSSNATEIEKTNKIVGVLDNFKLTIFINNNAENRYARENYINYLISTLEINDVLPSSFTLGEENALLLYDSNSANKFVSLLDFTKTDNYLSNKLSLANDSVIHDVCYQSGYYYLLCDNGNAPQHIYRAKADESSLNFERIDMNISTAEFTMFTVDTYSNIYLASKTSIAKLSKEDGYSNLVEIARNFTKITKLQTDLLGRLYVLDNGAVKSIENTTITDYALENVKAFAFDFIDNNAFLLYDSSEFIYLTTGLDNASISDLVVPDNFRLSCNPNSPTIANENLQFYKAKEGANTYVIKSQNQDLITGENFKFKALSNYTDEYVLICTVMYKGEQVFYALANQDTIVLIDINQVENTNKQPETLVKDAFIATDVCCYYLPIISPNDRFALSNNSNLVRIEKATPIKVKSQISFLDCDYYYAEFDLDGITYNGYIPCDFTVDVLTEDFEWDKFKVEKVNKTSVYKDSSMQEKVFILPENTSIRLLEKKGNISKIAYKNGDNWEVGYIYTSKIIDEPNLAIRNILIILAVVACLCGTSTYFLLRSKKRANQ